MVPSSGCYGGKSICLGLLNLCPCFECLNYRNWKPRSRPSPSSMRHEVWSPNVPPQSVPSSPRNLTLNKRSCIQREHFYERGANIESAKHERCAVDWIQWTDLAVKRCSEHGWRLVENLLKCLSEHYLRVSVLPALDGVSAKITHVLAWAVEVILARSWNGCFCPAHTQIGAIIAGDLPARRNNRIPRD